MYPGAEKPGFILGSLEPALSSWGKGGGEIWCVSQGSAGVCLCLAQDPLSKTHTEMPYGLKNSKAFLGKQFR